MLRIHADAALCRVWGTSVICALQAALKHAWQGLVNCMTEVMKPSLTSSCSTVQSPGDEYDSCTASCFKSAWQAALKSA